MGTRRASFSRLVHAAGQRFADTLFPPLCLGCGASLLPLPPPTLLCVRCRGRFVPVDLRASCSRCLRPLPPTTTGSSRCGACLGESGALERLLAVWWYEAPLSDALLALKFRRLDFLADALTELAFAREPFRAGAPFDLLVPVPLAPLRRLSRGFNQAERIARRLGRRLGVPVLDALGRSDLLAASQIRLGRAARRATEPENRYRVRGQARSQLCGRRILLVDDVVTTGATLRAAARTLVEAGSGPVDGFALAATPARAWCREAP